MKRWLTIVVATGLALVLVPSTARAHCDAIDGPVVQAARAALASRNVTPVLRWVSPEREREVKAAFARTLDVRALGASAETLADTWFFETVVRLHRAGEGAPFDGLKPAGHIEPILAMGDASLEAGSADQLLERVRAHVRAGIVERFQRAREAKAQADQSVEAGRRYVAAYVEYLHYLEGLHQAAAGHGAHEGTSGR